MLVWSGICAGQQSSSKSNPSNHVFMITALSLLHSYAGKEKELLKTKIN